MGVVAVPRLFVYRHRLFGTFAAAPNAEPLRFGIAGVEGSANPLAIDFAAWRRMFGEMRRANGLAAKLRMLLSRPA